MHCRASVSELYCVFIASMVVTYILDVCNVDMYNMIFIQIYVSAVGVERLASFLPLLGCFCRTSSSLSHSCVRSSLFSLSCDGFRALYMFTTGSKTTITSDYKI